MKKLIVWMIAIGLIAGFYAIGQAAKYESTSQDAESTVVYGYNGTDLVPLNVAANGSVITSGGSGGGSVNGTSLNITNLTINNTLSTPAGVDLNIASGSGNVTMGSGNSSSIYLYNATGVLKNCTVNATGVLTCS